MLTDDFYHLSSLEFRRNKLNERNAALLLLSDPMAVLFSVHQSLELMKSLKDTRFLGQKSIFLNIYTAMFVFSLLFQ